MIKNKERERIKEIVSVFIKHGIKEGITNITDPVRVRRAIEELGPTFVKIGQILSTRPDIIPESYIYEFQKLQDNVRPEHFGEIKSVVESHLQGDINELFTAFDETPIASASLAQVHLATLKSGEKVVVKIQRPKARDTMLSDIKILRRLTMFMKFTPQGHVINPEEVVDELMQATRNELDFLNEAQNIKKFHANNKEVKCITCPRVYDEYTTSNVLVMEYISGIKIANLDELDRQGYDLKDIALKLANNYLKQIFEDGFFHADPHPGNILIRDKKIVYIDFGMMGTLSQGVLRKFNNVLLGLATKNIDAITQNILKIGIKKGNVDYKKVYSDIEEIYNNYAEESLYDIDLPRMLDEVFKACRKNNIAMPREVTMFIKGLMTIEGVVRKLEPDINVMDITIPYAKSQILKKRDYKQDMVEQLDNLYSLSKTGLKIPVKFLELINSALAGKLKVQMEHTNLENSVNELNKMVNRIVFALIIASLIIGSSLVINADAGPKMFNISIFGFVGFAGTGILGLWLLISILRSGKM